MQIFEKCKMRKCLKKFSSIFEFGAKVHKFVNPLDLVKSFLFFTLDPNSNEYLLSKIGVDTGENGPVKVCQKLEKKLVRINIADRSVTSDRSPAMGHQRTVT